MDEFKLIRQWHEDKGIIANGNTSTQMLKLVEELGELGAGLYDDNQDEIIDAIGDVIVVLSSIAQMRGVDLDTCIRQALSEITKRSGKMDGDTFKKDGGRYD